MVSIGIIGGSGYTGRKIVEYCSNHPCVADYRVYGNTTAGQELFSLFPDLAGVINNAQTGSVNEISTEHDLYFIALPHGEALNFVPQLITNNKKVIDLGGDYRLDSQSEYENWYKVRHNSAYLLESKLYGLADLPFLNYKDISLIANPGCYPTATTLALLPLVSEMADEILTVSVTAYSGTSGAGKSPKAELLMSEMHGNARAYNVNNHRHQPEILQTLKKAGFNSPFSFTTHLLPVSTGIYATCSVHMQYKAGSNDLGALYSSYYRNSPFIRVRNTPPDLSWVTGTNFCDINISVKDSTIIITSAIDNLIKGAAGQAVQNMNKLYGWDERSGLLKSGVKNV